jgi:hypothetical protein
MSKTDISQPSSWVQLNPWQDCYHTHLYNNILLPVKEEFRDCKRATVIITLFDLISHSKPSDIMKENI